jgi:MFS family permease
MPAVRTISQFAEVAGVAAMPLLVRRLGIRGCMVVGLAAWMARDLVFALRAPWLVVAASLALHGLAFPCFFLVSQIYVDRASPRDVRASTQALLALVTTGVGNFLGVQLTGALMDQFTHGTRTDWSAFYAVPCAIAAACIVGFFLFFRRGEACLAPTPGDTRPPVGGNER